MGAIIGQQTGCDKEDPHAHLSGGAFPRCALLENPDPNPNPNPNPTPKLQPQPRPSVQPSPLTTHLSPSP